MATTYDPIATQTLASAQASVTFSSIPATYTDLVLVFNASFTANAYLIMEFNSDTGTNYSCTVLSGNGTATNSARYANTAYLSLASTSLTYATIVQLQNYSNTTTFKNYLSKYSNAGVEVTLFTGTWRNTAALNSITVKGNANTFITGSIFTLYGIKAA